MINTFAQFCRIAGTATLIFAVQLPPCSANDTEAGLGAGGLTFRASKHIEMVSEDLFVSSEQIVVDYRFRNTNNADETTVVAFPLPEIRFDPDNPDAGADASEAIKFSTLVNGKPVDMKVEQKALLRGRDETTTLERLSVPLSPLEAVAYLENSDQSLPGTLKGLGLLDVDGNPAWGLQITHYWSQTFAANAELNVEHRYRPIVGGSVMTGVGSGSDNYNRYCVDSDFNRAATTAARGQPISSSFSETYIDYILTTGANWLGPIRQFRRVVDKGHESNLVSFCGDGVRKISPTQFELFATNFVPKHDLAVLILNPTARSADTDADASNELLETLSCDDLWLKRNGVFKAAGYCFKSSRAISKFGNAGCLVDKVDALKLDSAHISLIDQIVALEQTKRCSP